VVRGATLAGLAAAPVAALAGAAELGTGVVPTTGGIVIHDAQETLRDYCRQDAGGRLWLVLPGGERLELVTSITDPLISNHGDGAFHPFDAEEVRTALAGVRYPLAGIAADVFILPYPHRPGLVSSAAPGLILLSPGVFPLSREQQHTEFTHELGHVVQYACMPDQDLESWEHYRGLRGIDDTNVYWSGARHADRPHEIFAEDFRALFGDALATSTGTIENADLAEPWHVPGLREFMLELPTPGCGIALSARPNPARGLVAFMRPGTRPVPLDVFDLAGRRLATLVPQILNDGVRWTWDGCDEAGRRVAPGAVFARARDGGGVVRVVLLP
jgi:hypothetical protein